MVRTKPSFNLSNNVELACIFVVALSLTLYGSLFFPQYKLFYFVPFIIRCFYLKTLEEALWLSCLSGFVVDLFSAYLKFGIHSIAYTLTTLILYGQKRNFFEDSVSTLPVLTFLYSILCSLIIVITIFIFERGITISFEFVKIDLGFLPLLDAIYAFICFSLPKMIFGKPKRKGKDYFIN